MSANCEKKKKRNFHFFPHLPTLPLPRLISSAPTALHPRLAAGYHRCIFAVFVQLGFLPVLAAFSLLSVNDIISVVAVNIIIITLLVSVQSSSSVASISFYLPSVLLVFSYRSTSKK